MTLICALCACHVDEPYYGMCSIVPYCSQQHARQDQHRHACGQMEGELPEFIALLEEAHVSAAVVGRAFKGSIPDMAVLLPYVDVTLMLYALFPLADHAELTKLFKEPRAVVDYFNIKYE